MDCASSGSAWRTCTHSPESAGGRSTVGNHPRLQTYAGRPGMREANGHAGDHWPRRISCPGTDPARSRRPTASGTGRCCTTGMAAGSSSSRPGARSRSSCICRCRPTHRCRPGRGSPSDSLLRWSTVGRPVLTRLARTAPSAAGVAIRHPGGPPPSPRHGTIARMASISLRRIARLAALATLAAAALAPVAHAAPATVATEQRATEIGAWAGTVAWSSFDPATNDYHLVVSRNGAAPQRLPVAPSPNAFDVDLGTNRSGSTYAVYSRCATPATNSRPPTGCDLYLLSLASGVEQKLDSLSSPTWDERDPTIFRGEIAFIRNETHGGLNEDVLRTGNTTSGARGTTALVKLHRLAGTLQDPELSASRVAYIRTDRSGATRDVHVRTLKVRGSDKLVYHARSGGANFANVTGPSLSDTAVSFFWARTNQGSGTGNRIVRYSITTGKLSYALGSSRYQYAAWASQALGMAVMFDPSSTGTCSANVNQPGACTVQLTGPLRFDAKP